MRERHIQAYKMPPRLNNIREQGGQNNQMIYRNQKQGNILQTAPFRKRSLSRGAQNIRRNYDSRNSTGYYREVQNFATPIKESSYRLQNQNYGLRSQGVRGSSVSNNSRVNHFQKSPIHLRNVELSTQSGNSQIMNNPLSFQFSQHSKKPDFFGMRYKSPPKKVPNLLKNPAGFKGRSSYFTRNENSMNMKRVNSPSLRNFDNFSQNSNTSSQNLLLNKQIIFQDEKLNKTAFIRPPLHPTRNKNQSRYGGVKLNDFSTAFAQSSSRMDFDNSPPPKFNSSMKNEFSVFDFDKDLSFTPKYRVGSNFDNKKSSPQIQIASNIRSIGNSNLNSFQDEKPRRNKPILNNSFLKQGIFRRKITNNNRGIDRESRNDKPLFDLESSERRMISPGNFKNCEKCNCSKRDFLTCSRARKWLDRFFPNKADKDYKVREYSNILDNCLVTQEDNSQIEKDLPRTYQNYRFFKQKQLGEKQLRNLLRMVSCIDPEVGYVQGMNFIVAGLLYHASEPYTYWLYHILFRNLDLKDIFISGLPGLNKHILIFNKLFKRNDPEFHAFLEDNGIQPQIYITEWLMAFGGYAIPIEQYVILLNFMEISFRICSIELINSLKQGLFFDGIFAHKWNYFYKVLLDFMMALRKPIMESSDFSEMMEIIKGQNNQGSGVKNKYSKYIKWSELLIKAYKVPLNQRDQLDIEEMMNKYNPETKTFDDYDYDDKEIQKLNKVKGKWSLVGNDGKSLTKSWF